ncbi:MAG: S-layer homology domain-containing protein [Rhizonema sp. PD37]|nr:S-layer homology domain-containing protein [Rhizonema sp. PD37]
MFHQYRFKSGCAAFMILSATVGIVAPLLTPAPSFAQTTFSDVQSDYWAATFIQQLSQRGIIAGFPDGSFHPEEQVTRAQYAAMLNKAFQQAAKREAVGFNDVPSNYWASAAIQQAYSTGFLSGYPGNRFEPNQAIPREQVLVSLANGLEYSPNIDAENTLQYYNDASNIDSYARSPIAAATERQIVVNYPNTKLLNPKETATRAQVAAFIYQALFSSKRVSAINSPYVVATGSTEQAYSTKPIAVIVPQGTIIPVKYDKAKKILLTKDETVPLTLTVSQNVVTDKGDVVIPAGSRVVGELHPLKEKGGSQFTAQKLVLSTGQEYQINATSEPITKTETISKSAHTQTILQDSAIGAGAAAAVSAVTGNRDITAGKILGGAGIGALFGYFFGKKNVTLITVDPNTDLQIIIGQNLQISLK